MKTLEKTFEMNADKSGVQTFTEVKREGSVAMYKRVRPDNSIAGFEVFLVKTRKKGDKLPGGLCELEDRECYPGAGSFGKSAKFCVNLEHAEKEFANFLTNACDENGERIAGKRSKNSKSMATDKFVYSAEDDEPGQDLGMVTEPKTKVKKVKTVKTETTVKPVGTKKVKTVKTVVTEAGTEKPVKTKGRKAVDRAGLKFPDGEWTMKQAHALNPNVCHATVWTYAKQMVKAGKMVVSGEVNSGRGKATLLYRFSNDSDIKVDTAVTQSPSTPF